MKDKSKEVSHSDDSESVDDPSSVESVEDKSVTEENFSYLNQETNSKENEKVSHDRSSNENVNVDGNSTNNMVVKQKQKSAAEVSVATKAKNSGNSLADVKATFSTKDLSPDDEIYIFQCPENFKKHDLLNKIIDISKSKQSVKVEDGGKFKLEILNSEKEQITLAVPHTVSKGKLFNLPLKGVMVIYQAPEVDSNSIVDFGEIEDTVTFPKDIKTRHPFLGVNWKSHINSAREAIDKNQFLRKMKKKAKKESINGIPDVENRKRKSEHESSSPKKHKKKECRSFI